MNISILRHVRQVILTAGLLLATVPTAARGADPDGAIRPFLDEGTFLVARLDVGKVDQEGFEKIWEELVENALKILPIPPGQQAQFKQQVMGSHGSFKTWLTDMDQAGAKQVYVLLDTADLIANESVPFVVVAPLDANANVEAVRGLMSHDRRPNDVVDLGQAVVLASNTQVERLKKRFEPGAPKVERPDLALAFAAAGDAPARIALLPTESARTLFEQPGLLPDKLGVGDSKAISRGLRYAALAMPSKPGTAIQLTLCGNDAAGTKALLDAFDKGKTYAKTQLASLPQGEEIGKELDAVKPEAVNDTISVKLPLPLVQKGFFGFGVLYEDAARGQPAPGQPGKPDDGGL